MAGEICNFKLEYKEKGKLQSLEIKLASLPFLCIREDEVPFLNSQLEKARFSTFKMLYLTKLKKIPYTQYPMRTPFSIYEHIVQCRKLLKGQLYRMDDETSVLGLYKDIILFCSLNVISGNWDNSFCSRSTKII